MVTVVEVVTCSRRVVVVVVVVVVPSSHHLQHLTMDRIRLAFLREKLLARGEATHETLQAR